MALPRVPETNPYQMCRDTPLANDGGLIKVICTHCLQKETRREAGPPSEETPDSSDKTSDSDGEDTSEDSQEDDTEDFNYAEGEKTR